MLATVEGPLVLVGSSMGGWLSLLMARRMPERIAGLVTIAAAPDFTETMRNSLTPLQAAGMKARGRVQIPSDYGEPYIITRAFLDEGKAHLVLPEGLHADFPVRFLQGTKDVDVPQETALTLMERLSGDDVRLTLVQGADHRFSTPDCLALIASSIDDVLRVASR
jgi:pimeloyl-ACP methyl ester carboxylesterase